MHCFGFVEAIDRSGEGGVVAADGRLNACLGRSFGAASADMLGAADAFSRAAMSVGTPVRLPASTSALLIHSLSV
jgi:hypothetical protein